MQDIKGLSSLFFITFHLEVESDNHLEGNHKSKDAHAPNPWTNVLKTQQWQK